MYNSAARNDCSDTIQKITQWHHDRNLIDGTNDICQATKLLEEFSELIAALYPGDSPEAIANTMRNMIASLYLNKRIKTVAPENAQAAKEDALGDMVVVIINHAERNKLTLKQCMTTAYSEIKDRDGGMVDGMWLKQSDLPKE